MKYTIPYEVPAETHLEALIAAGELVRTGVTIEAVKRVEPSVPGWFFVDLEVSEPDAHPLGNWTPETIAERKAEGLCATANDWCLVHEVKAEFGHYLATRPAADRGHNPVSGIAYDD